MQVSSCTSISEQCIFACTIKLCDVIDPKRSPQNKNLQSQFKLMLGLRNSTTGANHNL